MDKEFVADAKAKQGCLENFVVNRVDRVDGIDGGDMVDDFDKVDKHKKSVLL